MQDNDLISRAPAIAEVEQWAEHGYDVIHWTGIKAMLETQPALDAVPVIRCRSCRYYNTNYCGDGFGWCERKGIGHGTSDDWFCADGEERGKDE